MQNGKAKNTLSTIKWLLRLAKADFGKIPIGRITSPIVVARLCKVEANRRCQGNQETAKRLRPMFGGMFRFAIADRVAEIDPPVRCEARGSTRTRRCAAIINPANFHVDIGVFRISDL